MTPLSYRLYRGATRGLGPLVRLYLLRRRTRGKEDGARLGERFGRTRMPRPAAPLVWLHAASVGEAMSVLGLIERLRRERPALAVLVTTGTLASARLMGERLPAGAEHQYVPVDLPRAVARFLDHWRPDLAIWVESELWPNLVLTTQARGIPMLLVNGRLSARSHAHWRSWPALARAMLAGLALCLAQDDEQARGFRELGASGAASVGDLKAAAACLPVDAAAFAQLAARIGTRPLWLAASTHAGEEDIAAAVHRRLALGHDGLLTILVPRHPARGEAIAARLRDAGLAVARRSRGELPDAATDIYLADTMGELGLFYRLAPIAFIGGSLGVPGAGAGGHNPFEAARLDCAVLHGPDTSNCRAMADALAAAGAEARVADGACLGDAVALLLDDPALRAERAAVAARVAADPGTLERVVERLSPWLDALTPRDAPAKLRVRA